MRANEFIVEYRDRLLQYVKSLLPTWPDYVLKDWLVPNKGNFSNLPADALKNSVMEKVRGAGLTTNTKWQLIPNMKFTMDMFNPMTTQRLIGRAGGHSDMGLDVPRDKERHATQAALAQQQGGVRSEPVLLIKSANGYELLEGWHRTIQHFHKFPDGYTGPAYVAVAQGQQGVAEGTEQSLSSMVSQDQSERNEYKNFVKSQAGGDWSKGAKMYAQLKKRPSNDIFGDASRLNQFMKMKFDFDKFTDEDWDNYWLLAQHCDDNRDFQKNALSIIKKYQGTDHSHYKYLYDRISMGLTGKQKYGTQNTKKQGVDEGVSNNMSTEDMIAYLRQHHDTNLHQDYLNHVNTFSKFVLKDIPTNTLKTDLPSLDREKVERYKKMDQSKAPPIVLGGKYILDGYHRANAIKELGIPTIKAYVGITTK